MNLIRLMVGESRLCRVRQFLQPPMTGGRSLTLMTTSSSAASPKRLRFGYGISKKVVWWVVRQSAQGPPSRSRSE
jgi:hypothetical protein